MCRCVGWVVVCGEGMWYVRMGYGLCRCRMEMGVCRCVGWVVVCGEGMW